MNAGPAQQPKGATQVTDQTKGFFASLFDISFTSLITTKIIKVLYVISLILIGLTWLFFTIAAFVASPAAGVFVLLIVGPLASLFYAIVTRVTLEVVIALFRIMETNVTIAANTTTAPSTPPGAGQPAAPSLPGGPSSPSSITAAPAPQASQRLQDPSADAPTQQSAAATRTCPHCGAELSPDDRFCVACGKETRPA
jgi:hypothetical protein